MRINFDKYSIGFKGILDNAVEPLNDNIPIITTKDPSIKDNLLIKGENLHGLISLLPKYKGQIKMISIDPPYFTGSRDFYYNDSWVDSADSDKNSKYCSFMYQRIYLAKKLLTEDGVIVVFCDNNQKWNLKSRVLDPIFGDNNFWSEFIFQGNPGGRSDNSGLALTSEMALIYKNSDKSTQLGIPKIDSNTKSVGLRKTGSGDRWYDRKDSFYPFLVHELTKQIKLTTKEEQTNWSNILKANKSNSDTQLDSDLKTYEKYLKTTYPHHIIVWPYSPKNNYYSRWRWGFEGKIQTEISKLSYNNTTIVEEAFSESQALKDNLSNSQIDQKSYAKSTATKFLQDNLNNYYKDQDVKKFSDGATAKNPYMMRDLVLNFTKDDDLILDFFGGTMMTYVGVLMANSLDNSERKFIGITNHEGGHFENLTIPNIIESEKLFNKSPNHTICEIELVEAPTEEDKWDQYFHNEVNIFCDETIKPNDIDNVYLQSSIKELFKLFE